MHNKVRPIHVVQVLLFAAAAIGIGIVLVLGIGKFPLLDEGYTIKVEFRDVATLPKDAPVKIRDVNVGRVTNLHVDPQTGLAVADVLIREHEPAIFSNATAQVRTLSILGLRYVELDPGQPGDNVVQLKAKDVIHADATRGQGSLEELNREVGPVLRDEGSRVLRNLYAGLSGIEGDLHDSFATTNTWAGPLSAAVRNRDAQTHRLLANSSRFFGTLGDKSTEIGGIVESGQKLTKTLNSEKRELNRFFDTFPAFGRTLAANDTRLLDFARQGAITLSKLNNIDPQIRRSLDEANGLFDEVSASEGSLRSFLAVAGPTLDIVADNRVGLDRFSRAFPTFEKGGVQASSNYPRQTSVQIVNGEDAVANALIELQRIGQQLPLSQSQRAYAQFLQSSLDASPEGKAALARARKQAGLAAANEAANEGATSP